MPKIRLEIAFLVVAWRWWHRFTSFQHSVFNAQFVLALHTDVKVSAGATHHRLLLLPDSARFVLTTSYDDSEHFGNVFYM